MSAVAKYRNRATELEQRLSSTEKQLEETLARDKKLNQICIMLAERMNTPDATTVRQLDSQLMKRLEEAGYLGAR